MIQSKNKVLFKNIASLSIVQVVNYIFPLITIPYVSRIIGPDGFGVVNYITAFVSYFVLIIGYGFDFTATRQLAVDPDNIELRTKIFSEVTGSRVILFMVSLLGLLVGINFVPMLHNNIGISSILFLNVFSPLLIPQYIYQGMQKLSILSYLTLLKGVINSALVFLMVSAPSDLLLYVFIGVFSNFIVSISALMYAIFHFELKLRYYSLETYLKAMRDGKFVFFSSIVFSFYTTANILILGLFAKNTEIGYYTTAVGFITLVQTIINVPLSSSLFPYIGTAFAESKENGIHKLQRIVPIVFYFTLLVSLGLLVLAPFVVKLIYGAKFEGSIPAVRILSFLPLLSAMSSLMGVQTMFNLTMDRVFLKVTASAALLSIVLNVILGHYFNYIGTSISYFLTELTIVTALFLSLRYRGISIFKKDYFSAQNISSFIVGLRKTRMG